MTKTDFLSAWVFEGGFPLTREVRHAVDDLFYQKGDKIGFEIKGEIYIFHNVVGIGNPNDLMVIDRKGVINRWLFRSVCPPRKTIRE